MQQVGKTETARASHVEPASELAIDSRKAALDLYHADPLSRTRTFSETWYADLLPVRGPLLGPFPDRESALQREHDWLVENGIPIPELHSEPQAEPTPVPVSPGEPEYYTKAFHIAELQAREMMSHVPEVESVVVVPVWRVEQPRIAPAVIVGRNGDLQTPGEVSRVLGQMTQAMRDYMERQWRILQGLRDECQKLEEKLKTARSGGG